MSKQNLKLYSRATWEVMIKDPAMFVWQNRVAVARRLSNGIFFAGVSMLLLTVSRLGFASMFGLPSSEIVPGDEPILVVGFVVAAGFLLAIEWVVILVTYNFVIDAAQSVWKPIKARAAELGKPPKKTRRKRTPAAE